MYLKANALGLWFDANPADVEQFFSYPLKDESRFISSACQLRQ